MKLSRVFSLSLAALCMVLTVQASAAEMAPRKIKFASQSVGTAAYNRNSAMTQIMNKELPKGWEIEVAPISTGGPAGTLIVENGAAEIGEGINVPNILMSQGEFELKGKKLPVPKRAVSWLGGPDYSYYLIMLTEDFHKKAGTDSFEEIIAKKIPFNLVTKAPGSNGEHGAAQLLKTLGVTYDDIKKWGGNVYNVAPGQMADMLRENKADVSIDIVSLGQPATSELTMTKEMFFPQLADSTLKALGDLGYTPKVMPASSWKGQGRDLDTMVADAAYVCDINLPVDVVYAMTKAIVENKPELVKLVPSMEMYIPEKSGDAKLNGLPLHPGAEKYYREKGLLK